MQEILTVNELFSGIGAQRKALERLGVAHEVVGVCEIDKYAIQSYEAIFGKTYNYGDICTAERLEYADLWTYSFPCQDISVAGNQKGISSETRSGLLYQVQRLLEVAKDEGKLPKYLLLENVKNLVGKKFKSQFDDWLFYLDQLGYNTYWQVLNAKNYGIPQNRERVFAISIRKDLNQSFEFPKAEELTKWLKDVLEDEVDEKYYLSEKLINGFLAKIERGKLKPNGFNREINIRKPDDIATTITARYWKCGITDPYIEFPCIGASRGRNPENPSDRTVGAPTEQRLEINTQGTSNTITTVQKDNYVVDLSSPVRLGNIYGEDKGTGFAGNVWDKDAISPTLTTMAGGNRQPMIFDNQIKKVDIPQIVKVRKYEVDNAKLVELLRSHKNLTNKQISDALNVPLTKVEHWFRTDSCFAIPDPEIWYQLKELLNIKTDEFDAAITTFEEKEGVYEKSNRCYLDSGIAPTLTATSGDEKVITNLRIRKLTPLECWRLMGFDDEDFRKAEASGVSNTQLYKQAGNSIVVNVLEKIFKNLYK